MKHFVAERLIKEFGHPTREVKKIKSWNITDAVGIALQMDQPIRENAAYIWLPYPGEGQLVPEAALEYPGEAGRHSGTYPTNGLKRGEPALKFTIYDQTELDDVIAYIKAMSLSSKLPEIRPTQHENSRRHLGHGEQAAPADSATIDVASMPKVEPVKPRREAIPRLVQREVWQRDGGRCVECFARERLCFDHIIPFSKGGSNTVRNLQLLCESCNLSKSNRI